MKTTRDATPRLSLAAIILLLGVVGSLAGEAPPLPALTTVSGSPRLPGKFVWADLVTDDAPAASKFYAGLFGWTFRDFGGYLIAANDERPLCGMFQRPRPADSSAKPRWFGYLSVTSVERAKKAVAEAGGKVLADRSLSRLLKDDWIDEIDELEAQP